ncbi:MAG: amidohydrolase [Eubacteriales bacterium]
MISKASEEIPKGELIRGYHLDVTNIKEKRFPTRKELDKVAPAHPVWINSFEFHTSSVNTLALSMTNLPYSLDGIARDERNLPLGYFTGKASAFIRNRMLNYLTDEMRMKGVKNAVKLAVSRGITSINTMEGGYTFHEKDVNFIIKNKDLFPIDIKLFYQTFDINKIKELDLNCVGGDIFLDGAFSSRTAAVSSGYKDSTEDNHGSLYFKQSELNYFVREAHENQLQISLHAIGDLAIEQALNAYENAQNSLFISDIRHRIEHFELATEEQMQRAADLGLVIVIQPVFEKKWGNPGGMYEKRLGKDVALKTNNFRKFIDSGIILSGSSDSDITEMNPIEGIHTAVNHPKKEHSIDVIEALKMYTINSAYANFEEDIKGSLEKNKYADCVILSKNPLRLKKEKIEEIEVLATLKQGIIIYKDKSFELRGESFE